MEVQVTTLSRRGSALMRRNTMVSARRIRFGRGTGSEVSLSDIRVDLTAAAMFPLGGGVTIEALGPSPVRVNGVSTKAAAIKPGDTIAIGPYEIRMLPPPQGVDAAFEIELVQPIGDSLERLMSRCRIGLDQAGLSKRRVAWLGIVLVLLCGLVAPIAVYTTAGRTSGLRDVSAAGSAGGLMNVVALFWKPGELSNSHRFFAADCTACHDRPFASVSDNSCLACHANVGRHIPVGAHSGDVEQTLNTTRCADCHEEHRGTRALVVNDQRLCIDCHGSLAEKAPDAGVRDVGGFPTGHPQFRATVVADSAHAKVERVAVDATPPPLDRPGIKFSHAEHLVANGFPALGIKPLVCANCHVADPAGQGFQPVTYKQQCASCHALDFDRQDLPWPNARVPHGDDRGIAAAVWNYYAGKLLQGGAAPAAASDGVNRQVPGMPQNASSSTTPSSDSSDAKQWVAQKTEAALRTIVLDDKRGCAYCHVGTGPNGAFQIADLVKVGDSMPGPAPAPIVAPVMLQARFLPHAKFDHAKHAAVPCESCHAARQAETVGQMLIPGVENCAKCHGAEQAALHAQSTCTTCHGFHEKALGPMRDLHADIR
ncbi:MAG: cytochrome c3 family protein [Alphaproteobacteria bacterium]|nr:cytochrome c3 family protein [Alphaproteobacteria bacterium]